MKSHKNLTDTLLKLVKYPGFFIAVAQKAAVGNIGSLSLSRLHSVGQQQELKIYNKISVQKLICPLHIMTF
jgi:hypothetical protein